MTIEERLVAGETLTGIDALAVLNETESANWVFWTKIALAYLEKGNIEQAKFILRGLVERQDGNARLDIRWKLA